MNSGAPEELAVPAPLVTPVVLLLNDTKIIWQSRWTPIYVNKTPKNINKTWTFLRGNRNGHHNMELKAWRRVILTTQNNTNQLRQINNRDELRQINRGELRQINNRGKLRQINNRGELRQINNRGELRQINNRGDLRQINNRGELRQINNRGELRQINNRGDLRRSVRVSSSCSSRKS